MTLPETQALLALLGWEHLQGSGLGNAPIYYNHPNSWGIVYLHIAVDDSVSVWVNVYNTPPVGYVEVGMPLLEMLPTLFSRGESVMTLQETLALLGLLGWSTDIHHQRAHVIYFSHPTIPGWVSVHRGEGEWDTVYALAFGAPEPRRRTAQCVGRPLLEHLPLMFLNDDNKE